MDQSNSGIISLEQAKAEGVDAILKINKLESKVEAVHGLTTQIVSFLGDIETRIEAFKTLCIRKEIFTEADFEDVWNEIKGLEVRAEGDLVEEGDFVRISYSQVDKISKKEMSSIEDQVVVASKNSEGWPKELIGKKIPCEVVLDQELVKATIAIHGAKYKVKKDV